MNSFLRKPCLHILSLVVLLGALTPSARAEEAKSCNVPRSEISRAAYQRLAPQLENEMREKKLTMGQPIFIRILKEENEVELWVKKSLRYELFKTYTICKYSGGLGPKIKEGDQQSPEGFYDVTVTALNPWSNFHLSFNLGYPNEYDKLHKRTGGALMVHGKCASVGCFAMNDLRIEEIYTVLDAAMSNGQDRFAVHIFPFRMTWDKLARHKGSPWVPFWENLKQGYDYFQGHRTPPVVSVVEKNYAFQSPRPLLFGSDINPDQVIEPVTIARVEKAVQAAQTEVIAQEIKAIQEARDAEKAQLAQELKAGQEAKVAALAQEVKSLQMAQAGSGIAAAPALPAGQNLAGTTGAVIDIKATHSKKTFTLAKNAGADKKYAAMGKKPAKNSSAL